MASLPELNQKIGELKGQVVTELGKQQQELQQVKDKASEQEQKQE